MMKRKLCATEDVRSSYPYVGLVVGLGLGSQWVISRGNPEAGTITCGLFVYLERGR